MNLTGDKNRYILNNYNMIYNSVMHIIMICLNSSYSFEYITF